MKNVTLAVEEEVLEKARAYADKHGTTLNAIIRLHLEKLGRNEDQLVQAMHELREMSETTSVDLGRNYRFNRDKAYEERLFPRHGRSDLRGTGEE